jgi:two-component system, NtrC family, sensor kinase
MDRRVRRPGDFHTLGHQILLLASQGLLRTDFQRELSKSLIRFFDCDAVEVWLKDHEKYYFFEAFRTLRPTPGIDFRTDRSRLAGELKLDRDLGSPKPFRSRSFKSVATYPLEVDGENIAFLHLKSRRRDFFQRTVKKSREALARSLRIALVHRDVQVNLRERIKELTCLYEIARLGAQPDSPLEKILQGIVDLLPSAWLYPETASARIVLGERSYSTPGFEEGKQVLKSEILVSGEPRGLLEVAYREEKPELDEGPFLKEERSLIDTVAKEVGLLLKRRQDDEERSQLQEQLRHADRLVTIGQLASGIAHELNEPLGNILGFAQLAAKCPGLPSQAGQDIVKILNASLHAREVVRKLLTFVRQMPSRRVPVDLNRVIEEALFLLESRCAKEGIEVERCLSPFLPEVHADPSQLSQVLINLAVNAIQAMPEGGKLSIRTGIRGDSVLMIVQDSGSGMDQKVLKKIFTPFFTTKDAGQGTGLGLPVVHGIVASHGGAIHVESQIRRGTRFEIQLPSGKHPGDPRP